MKIIRVDEEDLASVVHWLHEQNTADRLVPPPVTVKVGVAPDEDGVYLVGVANDVYREMQQTTNHATVTGRIVYEATEGGAQ